MTAVRLSGGALPIARSSCAPTTFLAFRKYKPRCTTSSANCWRQMSMSKTELFGTASCPYTQEMREWLEWNRRDFIEHDVEQDAEALDRMRSIACAPQREVRRRCRCSWRTAE